MQNTNEVESPKKSNNVLKLLAFAVVIIALIFGVISLYNQVNHWFNRSQESLFATEEILPTIETADVITLVGDLNNINLNGYLEVNGEFLCNLNEDGFFNSTYNLTANDIELMKVKVGDAVVNENASTMSYSAYDNGGNILGYSEEYLAEIHNGNEDYAYFYFDENKEQQPYFLLKTLEIPNNTYEFLNSDGESLISIDYEIDYSNKVYKIYFSKRTNDVFSAADNVMLMCTVNQLLTAEKGFLAD